MDNLAHTLVGAALGRAVADRHVPLAGVLGAIAANAPDWTEFFVGLPSKVPGTFLVLHRGITHSLLGAAIEIAVLTLLVGVSWRVSTRPPWRWLLACIGAAILSHLFMDWQGSYGWRPFLPWSNTWYYLDWVAIADVFFWLVPLIALAWGANRHWLPLSAAVLVAGAMTLVVVLLRHVAAPWVLGVYALGLLVGAIGWIRYWFGPVARQRVAIIALLVLSGYSLAHGIAARPRKHEIRTEAHARFGSDATFAALTEIGHPFTWEAMYASADTVAGDDWRLPRNLRSPAVRRAVAETPEGRAIAQFARFLVAQVDTGTRTIYLQDARFSRGGRAGWDAISVRMD